MLAPLLAAVAQLFYARYQELRFRFYYGPIFHRFLNRKYAYYTSLPWPLKMKFLRIARDHYEYFEFVPRDNLKLTRAMKAIISCAAAQLLLFLPSSGLTFFKKIVVDPEWVAHFESYAEKEIANLNASEKHFFRRYAFDNLEEFFAVAVENFFERTQQFHTEQPELYRILANLFKQDPIKLYAPLPQQKSLFR